MSFTAGWHPTRQSAQAHSHPPCSGNGDLVRHLREVSRKQFLEILEQMTTEFGQYLQILEAGTHDGGAGTVHQVLEAVSYKLADLLQADRATIFLVDSRRGE